MKQFIIPSIEKITDVFDLLTDPKKYADMVAALKEAHTSAVEKLADLETKEQADVFLAQAHEKYTAAVKLEEQTSKNAAVILQNVAAAETGLKAKLSEFDKHVSDEQSVLISQCKNLDAARSQFNEYVKTTEVSLAKRAFESGTLQTRLDSAVALAEAKLAKINKALEA